MSVLVCNFFMLFTGSSMYIFTISQVDYFFPVAEHFSVPKLSLLVCALCLSSAVNLGFVRNRM